MRDGHIQHSVIVDLWKIADKDVRKLLNSNMYSQYLKVLMRQ